MKNIVLTGYQGYSKVEKVENLVESWLNVRGQDDELVVLYAGDKTEINEYLDQRKITNLKMREYSTHRYLNRFKWYSQVLAESEAKHALTVDIRDVIFQENPFRWMKQNLEKEMVFQDEGVDHTEWWNGTMAKTAFPDDFLNFKKKNVYNIGVVGGEPKRMASTFKKVFEKSEKSHTPIDCDFEIIPDQAAFNLLCHTTELRAFIQPESCDSQFCLTLGVNTAKQMYLINGKLLNHKKQPYCILHQYERQFENTQRGLYYRPISNELVWFYDENKAVKNAKIQMPENNYPFGKIN
jgi:hypothetical protein